MNTQCDEVQSYFQSQFRWYMELALCFAGLSKDILLVGE